MTYYVYWIKSKSHSDPYQDGYVGITNNLKRRFKYHSSSKYSDNVNLLEGINSGAIMEILHECSCKLSALLIEEKYRPDYCIGWNINKGGSTPPSNIGKKFGKEHGFFGGHHSEEHRKFMSERISKLEWFNDGLVNMRSEVCPDGFVKGRLPFKSYNLSEEGKSNLGVSGITVTTPGGSFPTIKKAAEYHNMPHSTIRNRINSNLERWKEWYREND